MNRKLLAAAFALLLIAPITANADPVPGDACSTAQQFFSSAGPELGGAGHFMVCQGGTWKSVLSFNNTAQVTKIGNQICNTNDVLKFDGTVWACAADAAGGDNLGNHTATQNIVLGSNYLSGDGGNEGLTIDTGGNISVTGTSNALTATTSSTTGRAVFANAAAATGSTYGVFGNAASTSGRGVLGQAAAASGTTYGVFASSNSPDGTGVLGQANVVGGTTYGVRGIAANGGYGGYFSGGRGIYSTDDVGIAAGKYLNWGATQGTTGYGIRDNAGTIEVKNSGGSWAAPGGDNLGNHTATLDLAMGGNDITGALTVTATGAISGAALTATGATAALNGLYLPAANTPAISANSVQVLRFNTVGSGVNYFAMTPSIGTSTVTLASAGTGATVPITLDAKGASSIVLSDAVTVVPFSVAGVVTNNASGVLASSAQLPAGQFPALTGVVTTTAGSLTTSIVDGQVVEADLNAIDAAADEECLTFEGGNFEWQACGAAEADPQVGTITTNGNWCRSNGSLINCDVAAPAGSPMQVVLMDPFVAGSGATVAHGWGAAPKMVSWYLECKTAELGYSVGDRIYTMIDQNAQAEAGFQIFSDATNVGVKTDNSTPYIWQKSSGVGSITASRWRLGVVILY